MLQRQMNIVASVPTLIIPGNVARRGWKVTNNEDTETVRVKIGSAPGIVDADQVQTISFGGAAGSGSYKLKLGLRVTAAIAYNANAAAVQAALRLLQDLASVTVSGTQTAGFAVTMVGVQIPNGLIEVVENTMVSAGTSQVDTVTASGAPGQGSFKLNFKADDLGCIRDQITTPFLHSANAAALQAYLRGFLADNTLTVTGTFAGGLVITRGSKGKKHVPVVVENDLKTAGTTLVRKLAFGTVPDEGSFDVVLGPESRLDGLAFGVLAATIQTALRKLPGFVDATVTGDFTAGFTFTFPSARSNFAVTVENNTLETSNVAVVVTPSQTTAFSSGTPITFTVVGTTPGVDQVARTGSAVITTPATSDTDGELVGGGVTLDHSSDGGPGAVYAYSTTAIALSIQENF